MKTGIIVLIFGLLAVAFFGTSLYPFFTHDNLGAGYGVLFIGYPLILIGVVIIIYKLIKKNK